MPIVDLGHGFMSVRDKVFALLWAMWLETGSVSLLRWQCDHAQGITSDRGTEALICDVGDMLPDFADSIGAQTEGLTRGANLFPGALWFPGWRHLWDGIIKRALSDAPFPPISDLVEDFGIVPSCRHVQADVGRRSRARGASFSGSQG